MKKLIALLIATVLVLAFAASCTNTQPAGTATEGQKTAAADAEATVLEDKENELWVAHGQYLLADGTENGWNGKDADLYEKSALKAISLKDVKEISEDVYTALSAKEVKYLYTIDLVFGTNDAGWVSNFVKDGVLYKANGSYCFKIAQCTSEVDGDTKVYSEMQWISDPKTAYAEALTADTVFYPVWQEEVDENGFSWASNPVVTGGSGLYTLVIAQYKNASAAGQPGFGVALVLKEARDGIAYEEIKTWVPADHTYGVIGAFNEWSADVAMEEAGENTWKADVTLEEGAEFKVRADGAWDNSWGNGADNCKAEAAGDYTVTITFDGEGNGTVTFEAK